MIKRLWKSILVLILLIVSLLFFYFYDPSNAKTIHDLSGNLFSEFFGALITLLIVDMVINRNEQKDRQQRELIAFKILWGPLNRQLVLFKSMIVASLRGRSPSLGSITIDLFDDEFFEQLEYMDYSQDAPIVPKSDWFSHIISELISFQNSLQRIVDSYAQYLDAEVIDIMEDLINSVLIQSFSSIHYYIQSLKRNNEGAEINFKVSEDGIKTIKDYGKLLMRLIEIYNKKIPDKMIELSSFSWEQENVSEVSV